LLGEFVGKEDEGAWVTGARLVGFELVGCIVGLLLEGDAGVDLVDGLAGLSVNGFERGLDVLPSIVIGIPVGG
jgi:hypothetical protein